MTQLSETTNQTGLVQKVEKWTRRPYGSSGNELREIIEGLNEQFDDLMPLVLAFNDQLRWDDLNHTDAPIGWANIVSDQNDYKVTADDNSLDILNLTNVRIYPSASSTVYKELERITLDDPRVPEIMSPNATNDTGTPSGFLEVGPIVYLDLIPDYNATNGLELFFQREQSRFTVTGTSGNDTTEPGIPSPFHMLLAWKEALARNLINRTDDVVLIRELQGKIFKKEKELKDFIHLRHPSRVKMTMKQEPFI